MDNKILSDEFIESKSKEFYDKYSGKGLTPSEVMELHKSEYWQTILTAQASLTASQADAEIAELKEQVAELKMNAMHLKAETSEAKAEVRKETLEEVTPIVEKLFEICEHADFSNGVEAYGMDVGRVLTYKLIKETQDKWNNLKVGKQQEA